MDPVQSNTNQGTPRDVSYDYVKDKLESLHGIEAVHSLHIWSLTLGRNALTVHLAIKNIVTHNNVLQNAKKLLKSEFDFYHVTIQVENYHQEVMSQCDECNEIR
ncbi:hypothetical protein LOTGIDRAFT_166773 [Lottia gigantea]|uniref:Cation efflux protein cytoplasmic domain-containing protein n=1 Tax=Lottia gigantea TaxID=225164 RepID=V4A0I5_LOTGI|nr:hypothetical protein LOTGIDRAFT_166773 [Lottia gigantea]ESO86771.1 hypothetical protein LOTGIDRAFT_166773 [Lottia gigantea]